MANLVISTGIVFNLFVFYLVYRVIEHEITKRKQAQAALGKALSELEIRLEERTAPLKEANDRLSNEISRPLAKVVAGVRWGLKLCDR
jgi:C4-dicarboxylate-specific signal transduction histidine kinase